MTSDRPRAGLYDPGEHRPLTGPAWSDPAARAAIEQIAEDALDAYRDPLRLWPNHPADRDDDPADERPYRCVYLGAAGMAWALHRLASAGLAPALPGLAELVAALPAGYRADPELTELETGTPPPPPSLLFGESGILLACEAIEPGDPERRSRLAAVASANARNRTRELCWGTPGTMIATEAMWRATGEERWRELWRGDAAWLTGEWDEPVWIQEMYGESRHYVGAGHGFASNAAVLLSPDLSERGDEHGQLTERAIETTAALAIRDHDLAQWPGLADMQIERRPLQWCHGAPGIVTALAGLPPDPRIDELLVAGGELTWQAGPLRKGVGLCHGTAGNAYAFLALHRRTGEERWIERARAFAMDAAADAAAWRERHGRGRYTLFTGDIGVALLLADCLHAGDAHERGERTGLPFITRPLG